MTTNTRRIQSVANRSLVFLSRRVASTPANEREIRKVLAPIRHGRFERQSKAHGSGGDEHRVVEITRGVGEAGADVFRFQVRIVRKDLLGGGAAGEHVEDVFDADTHATNAGAPAALLRINGDAIHKKQSTA